MTTRIHRPFIVGVLALIPLLSLAADPVVVKSVHGAAEIRRATTSNRWHVLRKGTSVRPGDVVRTGKTAKAELKLDDGSRVLVGSGTQVKVLESSPNRIFQLAVGRMKSFVKKLKPANKFEVRTPLAAASVRGTVFEVGYNQEAKHGFLDVSRGVVALTQGDKEVDVHAGQMLGFSSDIPLGVPSGRNQTGSLPTDENENDKQALRREVGLGMSKEMVMAAAADEMRLAEYQEGKTLIDVHGQRVRLEEYIIRRPAEAAIPDNAFKLVVLNERDDRFDYFYYRGEFNQALPEDLSVALNDVRGKLADTAPDYFLESYETGQSNTTDSVLDQASGGHQVKVSYDGTNYTLETTNPSDGTRTILADSISTATGETLHTVYDPAGDRYVTITDAQFQAGGGGTTVYDGATDSFQTMAAGDTYWRTNFNKYDHFVNGGPALQSYDSGLTNVLARDLDVTYSFAGGSVFAVNENPSGGDILHNRVTLFYGDGSWERVNTYILSDDGKIGPTSAFAGLTSGPGFKTELLQWNYEQVYESDKFNGRKIDLVVEPKILIKSGLIQ